MGRARIAKGGSGVARFGCREGRAEPCPSSIGLKFHAVAGFPTARLDETASTLAAETEPPMQTKPLTTNDSILHAGFFTGIQAALMDFVAHASVALKGARSPTHRPSLSREPRYFAQTRPRLRSSRFSAEVRRSTYHLGHRTLSRVFIVLLTRCPQRRRGGEGGKTSRLN